MLEKLTIEAMRILAQQKGGKCLSKRYVNNHTKLWWQCAKGHKWFARPDSVKSDRPAMSQLPAADARDVLRVFRMLIHARKP